MKLHRLMGETGYTTFGCMWKKGECRSSSDFVCRRPDGAVVPMQSRVTAFWPDGSVKWSAHTADAEKLGNEITVLPVTTVETTTDAEFAQSDKPAKDIKLVTNTETAANSESASNIKSAVNAETASGIKLTKNNNSYIVDNGEFLINIPSSGKYLISDIYSRKPCDSPDLHNDPAAGNITSAGKTASSANAGSTENVSLAGAAEYGKKIALNFRPELILTNPANINGNPAWEERRFFGRVDSITIEEEGPLMCAFRFEGTHVDKTGVERLRFVIRLKVFYRSEELKFTHTFIYDGEPEKDYLKGLSVVFEMPAEGRMYNRHIKFAADHGTFHESAMTMISWRPRVPEGLHAAQMRGEKLEPTGNALAAVEKIMEDIPFWDTYDLCQDSDSHFQIRKKLDGDDLCYIDALSGLRAKGAAFVGTEAGGVLFAIRDFWEKYPSGFTVEGLTKDVITVRMHLWSPEAKPFDFRHYARRGYNQVCYEGYDYKGADPYGIACTNELSVKFAASSICVADEELLRYASDINTTTLYTGDPGYYHDLRAFGYWSLAKYDTELEKKLEKDLELCFDFYKNEVEQRKWYGMFNYGDFMHTYDPDRHVWRYDVGGYAWDNTELVPTLWLWYYFMRTGRADVFRLAEKLTRHTSEVDVYHIGKYKGMGSRHNVIHWGCPCKEARIAMAGHHRFYYYLTGDRRLEDIFDELKDNEATFLNRDPLGDFYDKAEMTFPSHARSGPDWSSLCSNWMTQWERTGDTKYRDKIMVGTKDIENAPLKLVSGPDFEFDPTTLHLRYIGERTTGGTHLQICMGAPHIWTEMADLLDDDEWRDMLAQYGRFYFLPEDEKQKESGGIIGDRQFTIPMFACGIGAYGADRLHDDALAERVWKTLLDAQYKDCSEEGFVAHPVENAGNQEELAEIPWISTNHAAQFCLNAIMVMEFLEK
ncbi:MAG: hypothetical protein J5824_10475 [Lachnospiraceae bacterium]|nr:hypothetical protein [Lachnospiraceae bacterium]